MNIFVANLSSRVQGEDLRKVFEDYGQVESAKVIFDRETGNSKGFGFVTMTNDEEGYNAINQLNGAEWDEKVIVVKKARPRENNNDNRRNFDNRGGGHGGQRRNNYNNR